MSVAFLFSQYITGNNSYVLLLGGGEFTITLSSLTHGRDGVKVIKNSLTRTPPYKQLITITTF